jgi:hypothetical protein
MSASSPSICTTDATKAYLPAVNPAVATVEELDDWLVAQGARVLSPAELQDFVGKVRWSNVPGENPGDPDFPFGGTGNA